MCKHSGQESWKTWYTHFDDVATRRGWDHEKHLDMMLPKLKGLVGDYMFNDLSSEEHSNYKVLIKHLKHQFHKVESAKTYATLFLEVGSEILQDWRSICRWAKIHLWEGLSEMWLLCPGWGPVADQQAWQPIKFVRNLDNIDKALDKIVKYRYLTGPDNKSSLSRTQAT